MKFLIFSGHNDRAVISLCRFLSSNSVGFVICARSFDDQIFRTPYAKDVILTRTSPSVDIELFEKILYNSGERALAYCPTTEFINTFVLHNFSRLDDLGIILKSCDYRKYMQLSNKYSSRNFFNCVPGLKVPLTLEFDNLIAPYVLKPKVNLVLGKVLYPIIVRDKDNSDPNLRNISPHEYFAEQFIFGDSIYLCASIDKPGHYHHFWQLNLGQQVGGKSIVAARTITSVPKYLADVGENILTALGEFGYFGPLMIELRRSHDGVYFIEMNPRFWGPMQLTLDACPKILESFVKLFKPEFSMRNKRIEGQVFYLWSGGMNDWQPLCDEKEIENLLQQSDQWDIYERSDWHDFR